MFSKSCEYAIRAMIFIARKSSEQNKIGIKDIAEATHAPEHFIAKVLQDLSRRKLVLSAKGPNGGFYLDENSLNVTIADIVKATDGDGIYTDCVLGLKVCNEKKPCPMHEEYKMLKKGIIHMLETNRILDFKDKLDTGKFFLKN